MKRKKLPMNLSNEESQDIWSALTTWQKHLDIKANPLTASAIEKLIKRIRSHISKLQKEELR